MNIEGNEVVWKEKKLAITNTRNGFLVVKEIITNNGDGSSFRFWDSQSEPFVDLDDAILFAKNLNNEL